MQIKREALVGEMSFFLLINPLFQLFFFAILFAVFSYFVNTSVMNTIRKAPVSPALMTHVVAGFPSLSESKEMVRMMNEIGADVIEIQIPFPTP